MEQYLDLIFNITYGWKLWTGLFILIVGVATIKKFNSEGLAFVLAPVVIFYGPISLILISSSLFTTKFNLLFLSSIFILFFIKYKSLKSSQNKRKEEESKNSAFFNEIKNNIINENFENTENDILEYEKLNNTHYREKTKYLFTCLYSRNQKLFYKLLNKLYPPTYNSLTDAKSTEKLTIIDYSEIREQLKNRDEIFMDLWHPYYEEGNEDEAFKIIEKIEYPYQKVEEYNVIIKRYFEYDEVGAMNIVKKIAEESREQIISEVQERLTYKKEHLKLRKKVFEILEDLKTKNLKTNLKIDYMIKNIEKNEAEYAGNFTYLYDLYQRCLKRLYEEIPEKQISKNQTLLYSNRLKFPLKIFSFEMHAKGYRALTESYKYYNIKNVICLLTDEDVKNEEYCLFFLKGLYQNNNINFIHFPINNIKELTKEKLKEIKTQYELVEGNTLISKDGINDIVETVFNYLNNDKPVTSFE